MPFTLSLDEVKRLTGAKHTVGSAQIAAISGVATLEEARDGDIAFLGNSKYSHFLARTKASVALVAEGCQEEPQPGQLFLKVPRPSLAMAQVCEALAKTLWPAPEPGIHPTAIVSPDAFVDAAASIGPFCVIERGVRIDSGVRIEAHGYVGIEVRIGEGSWLSPQVTLLRDTVVGRRCRLHPGVVLGGDGFGYESVDGVHVKSPQVGSVQIGDDVEIGANTTIDRGRLGPTSIGDGTKIDNLVMIGHNARVGRHCILCGQVGLAGSANVEDYVVFGARSAADGHIVVGKGAQIAGASLVYKSVPAGKAMGGGLPAIDLNAHMRMAALMRRLPDLFKRLQRLESQLGQTASTGGA